MKKANKKQIKDLARKLRPVQDDLKIYGGGVTWGSYNADRSCSGYPEARCSSPQKY